MSLSIIFCALSLLVNQNTEPLTIEVEGVSSSDVKLIASIFLKENYLSETPFKEIVCTLEPNSNHITLPDMPDGEYSIFLFEDSNNNGELDLNFLGIPKEAFGFSQNPKLRFSAPSYEQTSFMKQGSNQIVIELRNY